MARKITSFSTAIGFWTIIVTFGPSLAFAKSVCAPLLLTSDDFIQSELWHSKNSDKYKTWAVETGNQTIRMLLEGDSIHTVLDRIAAARKALAIEMVTRWAGKFGTLREPAENSTITSWIGMTISAAPSLSSSMSLERQLVTRAFLKYQNWKDATICMKYKKKFQCIGLNHYTLRTGRKVEASELVIEKGPELLSVIHPPFRNSDLIFQDALAKLEDLRKQEPRLEEFLQAMFGYYNATRYQRGSSAIGRVFFSAYYRAVFKTHHRVLPDGVDVLAMIYDEDEFIRELKPYFMTP